jgi:hypothetical protein
MLEPGPIAVVSGRSKSIQNFPKLFLRFPREKYIHKKHKGDNICIPQGQVFHSSRRTPKLSSGSLQTMKSLSFVRCSLRAHLVQVYRRDQLEEHLTRTVV